MAVDIFIKIGDIKGESQDKTHKDEVDVLNWSWGMSQSGNMHMGGGGGAGKVNIQDLSLTKYVDKASPNLMMHCASGKHIDKVKLTVRKAGGESQFKAEQSTETSVIAVSNLVDTVAENRKGYTARQFENAKRARKLYHTLMCPSVPALKNLLQSRLMRNCPITTEDVDIAEKIFGKDNGTLKGKTTRPKPPIVKTDLVQIPPELIFALTLCLSTHCPT